MEARSVLPIASTISYYSLHLKLDSSGRQQVWMSALYLAYWLMKRILSSWTWKFLSERNSVSLGRTCHFRSGSNLVHHSQEIAINWSMKWPAIIFFCLRSSKHSTLGYFLLQIRLNHLCSRLLNYLPWAYFQEAWENSEAGPNIPAKSWFDLWPSICFHSSYSCTLNRALMTQDGVWSHKSRLQKPFVRGTRCSWRGFIDTFRFVSYLERLTK